MGSVGLAVFGEDGMLDGRLGLGGRKHGLEIGWFHLARLELRFERGGMERQGCRECSVLLLGPRCYLLTSMIWPDAKVDVQVQQTERRQGSKVSKSIYECPSFLSSRHIVPGPIRLHRSCIIHDWQVRPIGSEDGAACEVRGGLLLPPPNAQREDPQEPHVGLLDVLRPDTPGDDVV